MIMTIVATAALTALAIVLALNFATPEKKLERRIEHRYAVADPQFRREMGVMLGPAILPGNQVEALTRRPSLISSASGRCAPSRRSASQGMTISAPNF